MNLFEYIILTIVAIGFALFIYYTFRIITNKESSKKLKESFKDFPLLSKILRFYEEYKGWMKIISLMTFTYFMFFKLSNGIDTDSIGIAIFEILLLIVAGICLGGLSIIVCYIIDLIFKGYKAN